MKQESFRNAGKPQLEGIGPAINVNAEVKRLREQNKTWKEIYELIPHHYASVNSLQSSMKKVEEREYLKAKKNEDKKIFLELLEKMMKLNNLWIYEKTIDQNKKIFLEKYKNYYTSYGYYSNVKIAYEHKNYKILNTFIEKQLKIQNSEEIQNYINEIKNRLNKNIIIPVDCFNCDSDSFISAVQHLKEARYLYEKELPIIDGIPLFNDESTYFLKKEYPNNEFKIFLIKNK